MKLHGSLNWFQAKEKAEIYTLDFGKAVHEFRNFFIDATRSHGPYIDFSNLFLNKAELQRLNIDGKPVIVPPTWSKTSHHSTISQIWHQAAIELSEAKNICIIGYSLPETDSFFKYLLALGVAGDSRIKKFLVINPDKRVDDRFRTLMGPLLTDRYKFIQIKFSEIHSDMFD